MLSKVVCWEGSVRPSLRWRHVDISFKHWKQFLGFFYLYKLPQQCYMLLCDRPGFSDENCITVDPPTCGFFLPVFSLLVWHFYLLYKSQAPTIGTVYIIRITLHTGYGNVSLVFCFAFCLRWSSCIDGDRIYRTIIIIKIIFIISGCARHTVSVLLRICACVCSRRSQYVLCTCLTNRIILYTNRRWCVWRGLLVFGVSELVMEKHVSQKQRACNNNQTPSPRKWTK